MSAPRDLHALLDGYVSGTLNWDEMLLVDEHLGVCDWCKRRFETAFPGQVEEIADSPAPAAVWAKIRLAIGD